MPSSPDRARIVELLAQLVAFDTENPPGRERPAAEFLADALRRAGCEAAAIDLAPGRTNAIGRIDNGPGPVFAFNSHIDTVPAGGGWSRDPFRLTAADGRLYGRGACDAKGSIAAMTEAVRLLAVDRGRWQGTLIAAFVADEETTSLGARGFVGSGVRVDHVVVGEPTSNRTMSAHKGVLRPVVRVAGTTAHSSLPELGVNAIAGAARILDLVEEHHREIRARRHHLVGTAAVSATRIAGGIADNVIPDQCEIVLDRRILPGESVASAELEIEALLGEAARRWGVRARIVGRHVAIEAVETPADCAVVRRALAAGTGHGHPQDEPLGFPGGCDLVHFRGAGADGIILGPGSLDLAHKPDEFVPEAELVSAAAIYRDIALGLLGRG